MIRANKKIGIVYCANSEEYVEHLCEIIDRKKSEGYCVETKVVDNEIIDSERMLDARVFSNLDKCDYGMVFLTKDLLVEDGKYISRPNVLIELGYLRGRLGKNCIWCITDFPHKEIEEEKYLLPSDFVAEIPEEIDRNNDKADLGRIVERFIKTNNIVKLQNYDANNLVESLILNPYYKTDYEMLFEIYFQNAERILQHFQIFEKGKVAPIKALVIKRSFFTHFPSIIWREHSDVWGKKLIGHIKWQYR